MSKNDVPDFAKQVAANEVSVELMKRAAIREMNDTIQELKECDIGIGELSDGYHTCNELYYHRMALTSVIVNMLAKEHPDMVWKSKQHHDPEHPMYDGMFIVGINCPDGQATYHYDLPDWDRFHCQELDRAPEFDGHTPAEAIERISKLV